MTTTHVLLIGLRGSGKSTLGSLLARQTRRRFVDLDELTPGVLDRADVAEAFELDGEEAFREAEVAALRAMLSGARSVIALGGGTPTAPGAAELILARQAEGQVTAIYLRGEAETLRQRLRGTDNVHRPSLTGAGTLEEIDAVMAARDELYRSIADSVISIDGLTTEEVLELLLAVDGR